MPRLPRIHLEGAIYFVTSRASQGQAIFKDGSDYKMYLELLKKSKSQRGFRLYSYCLLPDRLELVIETGEDASISDIMHDLNSLYTKYFNSRYSRRGPLFESRFRSVLVEKAAYLGALTRHVHRAPLSSGVGGEHPYSSFHFYVGRPEGEGHPDLAAEAAEVREFLRLKDDPAAYEKYCLSGDADEIEALAKSLRRGSVLGSEEFARRVREQVERREERSAAGAPAASPKVGTRVFVMLGLAVVVSVGPAVYLYMSRAALQERYAELLERKEAEFAARTRFENVSPIAPTELDGTVWDIEVLPLAGGEVVRDRIRFADGRLVSERFAGEGFMPSNVSVTRQPDGLVVWETLQSSPAGGTVSWRGDWRGEAMKGVLSHKPAEGDPRDLSFYSASWSYASGRASR